MKKFAFQMRSAFDFQHGRHQIPECFTATPCNQCRRRHYSEKYHIISVTTVKGIYQMFLQYRTGTTGGKHSGKHYENKDKLVFKRRNSEFEKLPFLFQSRGFDMFALPFFYAHVTSFQPRRIMTMV